MSTPIAVVVIGIDAEDTGNVDAEDLVDPPIRAIAGAIQVPQTPGLGYAPNPERIARHTIRTLSLS